MSLFNLDRFRFDKKTPTNKDQQNGSKSPESEKENKPAHAKPAKSLAKSHSRGVVFEDEELLSETKCTVSSSKESSDPKEKLCQNGMKEISDDDDDDDELQEKMTKLLELFPQLSRQELLEVTGSTSTLEGAIASCLLKFGDKEATGSGRKRKYDESSSSQHSSDIQPSKKMTPTVVMISDDEDEKAEPSWEKQESMIRRLQRKFPDQDKEELRMVLQEHNWNAEDALEALRMFSISDDDASLTSPECEEKSSSKTKGKEKSRGNHSESKHRKHCDDSNALSNHKDSKHHRKSGKDSEDTEDTEDTSDSDKDNEKSTSTPSLSTWLKKSDPPLSSSSGHKKTASSSSTVQMLSRFASGTSIAKTEAAERKRKAQAADEYVSSEEENDEDSEFEDSEDDLSAKDGMSELKTEMLRFFQEASVDELTLIGGCSIKKAQKIVELRPFDDWAGLEDAFNKDKQLSESLLVGCKVVLKERKVVLGLMSKCKTISSKMVKEVTEVMKMGTRSMKQPDILNSQLQLKPYQLIGLKWLLLLNNYKLSGILADEMGLGKTIQAIAFLAELYKKGIEGPHLITVPASTLDNWVRELKLWCPSLSVLVYYGSMEDRRYLRHDILNGDRDFNVIVTTYNLAIGNDSDRSLFRKLPLKYAIFDEGHMLKNMNSLRYRHLMAINADHRLLLTGTPLQNNLLELMSLLNFIMPSMFSSSTSQLSRMFSMKSHEEQSRFERERISQAKLIMKPFILRRVKSEVLKQLPAKEETVEFCPMSEKQHVLYQNLFKKLKQHTNGEKRELANVMMQLRKMANHPLLHRQYYTTDKLKQMSKLMLKEPSHFDANASLIQEDMEVMSDFELHRLCQQYSSISSYQLEKDLLLDSGKFHHLTELLSSLKVKGDRVVLFSQFTMMLDIVEVLLKHLKHRYVRLDGSTPIADRIVLIDEFNTDPDIFVFLLSTRAGGLGINLTSANVVVLHDIDCNPYNDKQAEDRCHRVGQTRTVQVMKLISKDSIEDCILQLGQKKLKLEQDMTAAEGGGEGTIPEDMASLLKKSLGL
ncbi:SWI/SNF-related matrix-associated actin-dependent regulator of chromatin subfamily A containing DEAD/H box 1A isoform X2 [Genypterus blacodes]|uniref:SWI/SNF-related matrix-associated actin-dependent regulator of chromatin subfamily A containing DEAD/H box 1A isoform X2 n=1 Tax=Genypterus blacodes TaxID=154954 RepID=UPI003F75C668